MNEAPAEAPLCVYQVVNWRENFENAKSVAYRHCAKVSVPNKLNGLSLNWLLREPDGTAILGLHHLIVCLCSGQPLLEEKGEPGRDGWLTENGKPDGRPLTAEDLAVRFGRTPGELGRALTVLSSPRIGWLRRVDRPAARAGKGIESGPGSGVTAKGSGNTAPMVSAPGRVLPAQSPMVPQNRTEENFKRNAKGRLGEQRVLGPAAGGEGTNGTNGTAGAARPVSLEPADGNGHGTENGNGNGATKGTAPGAGAGRGAGDPRETPENWTNWSLCAQALRGQGWPDEEVRRLLSWARHHGNGAWRDLPPEQHWHFLAVALHVRQKSARRTVPNPVGYVLTLAVKPDYIPPDHLQKAARCEWEQLQQQQAPPMPAWFREALSDVFQAVPKPKFLTGAQRWHQRQRLAAVEAQEAGEPVAAGAAGARRGT